MQTAGRTATLLFTLLILVSSAFAADGSSLKPPAGARVAVIVFEDLECPYCAYAYPLVWQAAKSLNVPVELHDFPLTKHPWAFQAAVYARFFDTSSRQTGNDFRGFIYQNQEQVTPGNLHQYAEKFANDHHVALPSALDPQGKLKEAIEADLGLGRKCNLNQTPTIFVVGAGASPSFLEVNNLGKLSDTIQEMQKLAGPAPARRKTPSKGH